MSDPIIVMLDALNTVGSVPQKSGTGWSCRCPAHDDKHPSLSIGIGEKGRLLLNCHAGCETKAIMTSLGLEMKDLMPHRQSTTTPTESQPLSTSGFASPDEAVATLERTLGPVTKRWLFTDAAGEPVDETLRWESSTGKIIRPVSKHGDRWLIKAMPTPRPLMHLPELTDLPDGAWVSIVEGSPASMPPGRLGWWPRQVPVGARLLPKLIGRCSKIRLPSSCQTMTTRVSRMPRR